MHRFLQEATKGGGMTLLSWISKPNPPDHFPTLIACHLRDPFQDRKAPQIALQLHISRRAGLIAAMASILLARDAAFGEPTANAFEFRMTTPDQTVEEAERGIRGHAQNLVQVRDLLESGSWKEAQKALRKSSSYLKQDIYTIIQAKPGNQRPQLRKLYSVLFNSVTRLDYAARDKDVTRVRECYDDVVTALNDILSRLL